MIITTQAFWGITEPTSEWEELQDEAGDEEVRAEILRKVRASERAMTCGMDGWSAYHER